MRRCGEGGGFEGVGRVLGVGVGRGVGGGGRRRRGGQWEGDEGCVGRKRVGKEGENKPY